MSPQFRFIVALFVIIGIIALGTLGFMLIEGWSLSDSLYMTFITVSTIGFGEVEPLSPAGRHFIIIYIILSVMTVGYTITVLLSFLFEGQFRATLEERRMKRFLASVKDHFIICGFGDVGRETAEEFQRRKVRFVVVDLETHEADRERFPSVSFVPGDATEEETLDRAGIMRAKGLIACLPEDQQNVFTVLTARQQNPELMIVSQASEERTVSKLQKAGADRVISPKQIAGRRLAALSIRPSIVNFLEVLSSGGDETVRIESVQVGKGSSLVGRSLKECGVGEHTGAIIIGILDSTGNAKVNAATMANLASLRLKEQDTLIALGTEEQISELVRFVK